MPGWRRISRRCSTLDDAAAAACRRRFSPFSCRLPLMPLPLFTADASAMITPPAYLPDAAIAAA